MTKKICRLARYGLLAAVLTVSLAACGSEETGDPSPDPDITDTNSSPEPEGTGPEPPRPPDDGTSVSFPDLPAGEDDYDSSQVRQCVTVEWLGQDNVPDGVSVQVKSVRITPGGVFELIGSSCDGVQGCTDSFAFTSADESCSVSIKATASNGTRAFLRLAGRCVSKNAQQCDVLLADDGSPIPLYQPKDENPPEDEAPPEDEDPSSEEQQPPPEESPPPTTE